MSDGWIKLHRRMIDWEWIDEPLTFWVFMKCLLLANHVDSNWHGIDILRGSFISSVSNLASKKATVSTQNVRTALARLKSTNEITITTTKHYSLITVLNWSKYQDDNKPANIHLTNSQQTANKQLTTVKNEKNEKNEKNILLDFKKSINYLEDTPREEIEELSRKFFLPEKVINTEREKALDWLRSTGARKTDYPAFFRNWLRRFKEKAEPTVIKPYVVERKVINE